MEKKIEGGLGKKKIGSIACIAIIVISLVFNGWFYIQVNNLKTEKENLQEEYATLSARNQTLSEELNSSQQENERLLEELNASYNVKLGDDFAITYPHGLDDYAEAILKICDNAHWAYYEIYHLSFPVAVRISIFIFPSSHIQLETKRYHIYLHLPSDEYLLPPTISGVFNIFGFCHEIGHIMFMVDNGPFSEGWASYAAAFQLVPFVYRSLGEDAWPQPYNYSKYDGPDRYLKFIENEKLCKPSTSFAAVKILYTIDQKYGAELIGWSINTLKKRHTPSHYMYGYPQYSLEKFKEILVELTNDSTILGLFSEYGF